MDRRDPDRHEVREPEIREKERFPMKMPKNVKKIWDVFTSVIVILVVIAAIFLMGSRLIGLQVFNVVSGSMEPTYSVGDLIYVKTVDPDSVKAGDVITFVLNEELVVATHRVVKVDAENRQFTTKGDANEHEDVAPVHFNNLIGVPVLAIPLLGYVSAYIQSPPGLYVAIALGVILLAVVFLPDLLTKKNKKETEAKEEAPAEPVETEANPEKTEEKEENEQ